MKQAVWFGVGVGLALVLICCDYRFLVSRGPLVYALSILALIAVLVLGASVKGSQRWLGLGVFGFQPSEPGKVALVYMLAWYLSKIGDRIRRIPYVLLACVLAGVPTLLILRQPNLGTAVSLLPVLVVMLYVAGCRRWHLVTLLVLGVAVAPLAWHQLKDYQKARLVSFLNPQADAQRTGWQTIQTKITVGSGQLWGKGFRQGTQTHLSFLPEHHTDFIFAVVAEEEGFVGAVAVVGLFMVVLGRGLWLARACQEIGGTLLGVGCITILAFHVLVNIAITTGLLPVTGLPLPFLSYGGSFCLTTMLCMGTVLSVQVRKGYFSA
jgi:rod shape determining protein RodA